MDIDDPIKTTVEEIRKTLNIDNVVGDVIEVDDKVLIPITKMGMGFGAGGGQGKGKGIMGQGGSNSEGSGEGEGGAAGGAGGVEPIAMVVIFKNISGPEGVKILTLSSPALAQALGEVGAAVMKMMEHGMKGKGKWMKQKKGEKEESEEKSEKSEMKTPKSPIRK